MLKELVNIVFEHSLYDKIRAVMYKLPIFVFPTIDQSEPGRKRMITFKHFLLMKCQTELERADLVETAGMSAEEVLEQTKMQEHMLDSIRLIGNLFSYKSETLDDVQIVYSCINRLLTSINNMKGHNFLEETVKCLCTLITTVRLGEKFSKEGNAYYCSKMRKTAEQLGKPEIPNGRQLKDKILHTIEVMENTVHPE